MSSCPDTAQSTRQPRARRHAEGGNFERVTRQRRFPHPTRRQFALGVGYDVSRAVRASAVKLAPPSEDPHNGCQATGDRSRPCCRARTLISVATVVATVTCVASTHRHGSDDSYLTLF